MRRSGLLASLAAVSLAVVLLVTALPGCGGSSGGSEPLTLALDFQPNAAHAGVYTAVREHLDRRHGIALRIRAPSASTDSLKLLATGRADVSIVDIHDLWLAHERGEDVVGIGAIVERPLAAVIARPGVRRPRNLEGKRVGVTGLPSDDAVLRAVVEHDGGRFDRVKRETIGFSAVPSLITGKVQGVTAFWNAEGVALRHRGVRTNEFRVDDYGAPRYPELVLVTRGRTLARHRAQLLALLDAVREGTTAALRQPAAAARQIARAGGADYPLTRAELAAVAPALRGAPSIDRHALPSWAAFDERFGIVKRPIDVNAALPILNAP